MVFGIVHGRIKAAPGRVPPITVARKAMISESPVNTFIEIGVSPTTALFSAKFRRESHCRSSYWSIQGTK
jgi:hypothetical protein